MKLKEVRAKEGFLLVELPTFQQDSPDRRLPVLQCDIFLLCYLEADAVGDSFNRHFLDFNLALD